MKHKFFWFPTGEEPIIKECLRPDCNGEYQHMEVRPRRSKSYLNRILLCRVCKGVFPQ